MKVTITKDFESVEDAVAFLKLAASTGTISISGMGAGNLAEAVEAAQAAEAAVDKVRKARSDAGQPRAPYKPRAATVAKQDAPPAAPATPAAGEQPAPAAAGVEAVTFDHVKAATQKVHDKAGLGMDSCVTLLKKFGTNRVTGVKPEQYADYVAAANNLLAGVTF